jgi:selenocysteine lyase/cysteine desulfurase
VDRGPVISFTLDNPAAGRRLSPMFVSQALAYFNNVVTRAGMFCAHPYMYYLQGVPAKVADEHAQDHYRSQSAVCSSGAVPSDRLYNAVRASFSFVTPQEYLDELPDMLREVQKLGRKHNYPKILLEPDQRIAIGACDDFIKRNNMHSPWYFTPSPFQGLLQQE